jgi:hypothetical protein
MTVRVSFNIAWYTTCLNVDLWIIKRVTHLKRCKLIESSQCDRVHTRAQFYNSIPPLSAHSGGRYCRHKNSI